MNYKGYTGKVEYDDDAGILFGKVVDIADVITFQGTSVDEIRQAFRDSIDDYLEFCNELGKEPARPFSGQLPFRTTPEHHRLIFLAAQNAGKSMNGWMDDVLTEAARGSLSGRDDDVAATAARQEKTRGASGQVAEERAAYEAEAP